MYMEIYGEMVADSEIPVHHKAGEIVEYEELAFSKITQFMLLQPHKLLLVDEVGSNMTQAKDRHCGGLKLLVPTELQLQICSATY